jgi:hypothetical protein
VRRYFLGLIASGIATPSSPNGALPATLQARASAWAGLAWLTARGHLAVASAGDDEVQLMAGAGKAAPDLPRLTVHLKALIEETAAYRAYFARAERETLRRP